MTETSTLQKAAECSLTWGWAPGAYLRQNVVSGSPDLREPGQSSNLISGRDSTISDSFVGLQSLKAAKNKNFL